jgi:excinuclease ABC subunit C
VVPQRGDKLNLIAMAEKNALTALESQIHHDSDEDQRVLALLVRLQEELELTRVPRRIECFDISNIQGSDNVASMVVFENARAKKSDYRTFKVRSVEGEADDFASRKEVVGRRYSKLAEDDKPFPDLIVIDGGKGQLNAALEALAAVPPREYDIIGLAKKQEEVYFPGRSQSVVLSRRSEALHLLQRVRDEAHRFAVTFHRKRRAKRALASGFDNLPGVGPGRRKALVDHFATFDRLASASLEEIYAVPGLPKNVAVSIYNALHAEPEADHA